MISINIKSIILIVGFILVINILAGCSRSTMTHEPESNMMFASRQAAMQIAKAGGVKKVCKEANQMFYNYGFTNNSPPRFYLFNNSELTNYPTLTAIGNVDGIWTGPPDYIKIHVGTRPTGYYIEIVNTNNQMKRIADIDEVEIVEPFIFMHR